jgi:arylsulfatase A-like enzyme
MLLGKPVLALPHEFLFRMAMLLVSNPGLEARTIHSFVETAQVAPTILKILGLDPNALDAVRLEGTQVLPSLFGDK